MSQALSAAAFDTFATLLKNRSGLVIGTDKLYLLETRLASILKREQCRDLAKLAERLRVPGSETLVRQVVEAMTTNESFLPPRCLAWVVTTAASIHRKFLGSVTGVSPPRPEHRSAPRTGAVKDGRRPPRSGAQRP
jgi:hypothetical protein